VEKKKQEIETAYGARGTRQNLSRCEWCNGHMERFQDTFMRNSDGTAFKVVVYLVCSPCGRKTDGTQQAPLSERVREEGDLQRAKEILARPTPQQGSAEAWDDDMFYSSERPGSDGGR